MAMRSLVFKMKAVPRGVPGSRTFATVRKPDPKNDPWSKISAELRNSSKYRFTRNLRRAIEIIMEKEFWPSLERRERELEKEMGNLRAIAALIIGGGVLLIAHNK